MELEKAINYVMGLQRAKTSDKTLLMNVAIFTVCEAARRHQEAVNTGEIHERKYKL
jgi:hypothetical protein